MAFVLTESTKFIDTKNVLYRASLGVALCGLAYLGNVMNVDMFFGVKLLFGGVFAWIAFLLLGPAWGICAVFVASLYTIQLWGHGYAAVLFFLEFVFVALFLGHRKTGRIIALILVYWIIVGGPLALYSYGFLLDLPMTTVELIIAKQTLNGITNACIGVLIYYVILLLKPPVPASRHGATFPNFLQVLFLFGMIFPLGANEVFHMNRTFHETIQQRLDREERRASQRLENLSKILKLETEQWEVLSKSGAASLTQSSSIAVISPKAIYTISDETGALQLEFGEKVPGAEDIIETIQFQGTSIPGRLVGCVEDLFITASNDGGPRYFLWYSSLIDFIGEGDESSSTGVTCMTDWTRGSNLETEPNSFEIERDTSDNVTQLSSWLEANIVSSKSADAAYPTTIHSRHEIQPLVIDFQKKARAIVINLFIIMTLAVLLSYLLNGVLNARFGRFSNLVEHFLRARSIDEKALNFAFKEDVDIFKSLQSVATSLSKEEAARKTAAEGFYQLIEDTLTPVFATDGKGTIKFWNKTLETLTGFHKEDVIGRPFQSLASVDVGASAWDMAQTDNEFEFSIKTDSGKFVTLYANQTILQDISLLLAADDETFENADPLHFFVAQDQTEATNARAHMVHMSRMAALGEMSSSIAHELNQPLNVISMAAGNSIERMSNGTVPSEYLLGKMQRIEQQAQRAGGIIHNLREFALAGPEDDIELFDPVEHCKSAVELMSEQLRLDSIAVDIPDFAGGVLIEGRPVLFEQVIVNILNNARQAMSAHYSPSHICKIDFTIQDNILNIEISDTGPGIEAQKLSRIFDPFYSTKSNHIGTGIGLYMSKSIVNAMNGEIWAYNSNTGAVVAMRFPIAELISEPSGQ